MEMNVIRQTLALIAVNCLVTTACVADTPLFRGDALVLDSGQLLVQSREGQGPIRIVEDDTISVTVVPGDQWPQDVERDKGNERAELSSQAKILYGGVAAAQLAMRFYSMGEYQPGRWATVMQLHGPNRGTLTEDSNFRPPVLTLQQRGDEIAVVARGGNDRDNVAHKTTIGTFPADFGQWHDYRVNVALGENGYVLIDRDGEPLIRWSGAVGYDAGDRRHYWKMGIYRSAGWDRESKIDLRPGCIGKFEDCEN